MINPNFVLVGVALNFLGGLDYLIQTIKGKTKPNRVTWFLWALAALTAFAAEIHKGVGIQSLMTFSVGLTPLLIFLASFVNKKSQWKLGKLDLVCGCLSLIGLLLWYITKESNFGILFGIATDGLAALPTVVKSYNFPETERHWTYSLSVVNATITLLTIDNWRFPYYGFPAYILFINLILFILVKFKVGSLIKSKL